MIKKMSTRSAIWLLRLAMFLVILNMVMVSIK